MRQTIPSLSMLTLSLASGLILTSFTPAAFANTKTVRTGPQGNTQTTTRTYYLLIVQP